MDGVADDSFSRRNDHFIFSEDWWMIAAYANATSVTRIRSNIPDWNAFGRHIIWPVNRDADVPDIPKLQDLRQHPLKLPKNEELAFEIFNDLGAGNEDSNLFLWLAGSQWNRGIPVGQHRATYRATVASFTTVADSWSALQPLVFDDTLRGGTYAIVGVHCFTVGPVAYRFNFPRAQLNQGRYLRPGGLCLQAINEHALDPFFPGGEFGRFYTFENPTIQFFSNAAAAETPELMLDMVYLGPDRLV